MCDQHQTNSEMLSVTEYAKRHGKNRNTVVYWCKNDMMPGVSRIPAEHGGFCRYKYMIPADAQPKKKEPNIDREPGMMTTSEFAKKMGVKTSRVLKWCEKGKLKGICKVPCATGFRYLIPENAEPEKRFYTQQRKAKPPKPKPPEPPKTKKVWAEREINLHIRRYCGTRTYQQLSNDLEISVEEVRRRYERLHGLYGI